MQKILKPLISKEDIRLAMIGMVSGNGHPYSWSAIFNGYDSHEMARCPYPVIPLYLSQQPKNSLGIPKTQVTHIWCDDYSDAERVARTTLIPHIVTQPEEVIGKVDAVIIPTDRGEEHIERCRPFVEAGLPLFIDKPLTIREDDLRIFQRWVKDGKPILSSSSMRYCKEFLPYRESTAELGQLIFASITMTKCWERYSIHALEGIYPIFGKGFLSARHCGSKDRNIVHYKHECGADIIVAVSADLCGKYSALHLCGTQDIAHVVSRDTFYAFKAQLSDFVQYLRTGIRPYEFYETEELIKMLIAGMRSLEEQGREVFLSEIAI